MATRSLGRLTLDLVAQIGGYEASMSKVNRTTKATMKDVEKWTNAAAKTLAGLGVAATASSIEIVRRSSQAAKELQNFSFVANATTKEMQVLSFAGRDFNLSTEKIADILKDVNDRVGDFLSEGAGPMSRFFEQIAPKVGVTAEQFRNLSGPQALQLYVDSLDKANISQAEATTYMEELASDATALLPLLRDNGKELAKYAQRADELNIILSDVEIENLADVSRQMEELGMVMDVTGKRIAAGATPAIEELMDLLQDQQTIENLQTFGNSVVSVFTSIVEGISETVEFMRWFGDEVAARVHGIAETDVVRLQMKADQLKEAIDKHDPNSAYPANLDYLKSELEEVEAKLKKNRDLMDELTGGGPGSGARPPFSGAPESDSSDPGGSSAFNPFSVAVPVIDQYIEKQDELNGLVDDYLANSRKSLELMGKESEVAKVLYEIEHGRFSGLSDVRQQALVDAAERMDAAREEQRMQEEVQEKHRESMELAAEYRALALSEEEKAMEDLKLKYEEIRALVAEGMLTPEEGKAASEAVREEFDALKEQVEDGNKEMSAFADEAARNMQGAFADFLFDPFEDGLDGMLKNFAKVLQRMAAEAAAAEIFGLLGFGGAPGGGGVGGIADIGSDLGFEGFFDAGGNIPAGGWGVVGERGPELVSGPANVVGRRATAAALGGGGIKGVTIINNGEPVSGSASMTEEGELEIVLNAVKNSLREDLSNGRGVWREAKQKFGWSTKGAI